MTESLPLHKQCDNIDEQIRAEIKTEVDNNNDLHRCACLIRARANLQECISNLLEADA